MKQHITLDDLNQLSDNGKEKLIEWKVKHDREQTTKEQIEAPTLTEIAILEGSLMSHIGDGKWLCLSIGQMIEFLGDKYNMNLRIQKFPIIPTNVLNKKKKQEVQYGWEVYFLNEMRGVMGKEEHDLVDVLWEAVKLVIDEIEFDKNTAVI